MLAPFRRPDVPARLLLAFALAGAAACDAPKRFVGGGGEACRNSADFSGASLPFHQVPIDNANDFSSAREAFRTSTRAQSGYTAYATWDECALYLGYTGSALGTGDCTDPSGPTCSVADLPESADRYLLFYLNTDPRGEAGTRDAMPYGRQDWVLPFAADFLLSVRTDGRSVLRDSLVYVGNTRLFRAAEGGWVPIPDARLRIGDNSSSNFLEARLPLAEIGSPCAVEVVGWVVDSRHDASFAFWPAENAAEDDGAAGDPSAPPRAARSAPADSGRAPADSARAGRGEPAARRGTSAEARAPRSSRRLAHYYGFPLRDDVIPNVSANLDRTVYEPAEGCGDGGS